MVILDKKIPLPPRIKFPSCFAVVSANDIILRLLIQIRGKKKNKKHQPSKNSVLEILLCHLLTDAMSQYNDPTIALKTSSHLKN